MKVLITAGDKTSNILGPLSKRFSSGAVQLKQEKYIEQVFEFIQKGEVFDRLIVIEQALIGQDKELNENNIRERMIKLVEMLEYVDQTVTMVFVVTDDRVGNIVNDEMFNYTMRTKVIKLLTKYTVSFFVDICTKDMRDIKNEYTGVSEVMVEENRVSVDERDSTGYNIELPTDTKDSFSDKLDGVDVSIKPDGAEEETEEEIGDVSEAEINRVANTWFTPDMYGETETSDESANSGNVDETANEDEGDDVNTSMFDSSIYEDTVIDAGETAGGFGTDIIEEAANAALVGGVAAGGDKGIKGSKKLPWSKKERQAQEAAAQASMGGDDMFGDNVYENENIGLLGRLEETNVQEVINILNIAASRHSSYVFTGARGCGVTAIAFNVACMMSKLGFSVLYVDCDTVGRGSSYINYSNYDWVHTNENTRCSLLTAVGNPSAIDKYVGVIAPGFHTLGAGLDQDMKPMESIVQRDKFHRFINLAKENYNFVIYDTPFSTMTKVGEDAAYLSDKILYITDSNTKGFMNLLLDMANVDDEDLREVLFNRIQVILNRHRKNTMYFSKNLSKLSVVLKELDRVAYEVTGGQSELSFADLNFACTIPYLDSLDNMWFTKKQYVDSKEGQDIFLKITKAVVNK